MLKSMLVAAGLAALAVPASASAQAWGGGDYGRPSWGYGYGFAGYPQFRDEKAHIRAEIREGLNEGWLDRGQARDFGNRLQWIQRREAREFQEHGWRLPDWDQQSLQSSLDQIDRAIDQARDGDDDYR
ncbi:MAG: hypothetical protein JSR86_15790 [Proteobacteria bacterium]|nr:hypothetical protein [Pseudomonadota bacterium]